MIWLTLLSHNMSSASWRNDTCEDVDQTALTEAL